MGTIIQYKDEYGESMYPRTVMEAVMESKSVSAKDVHDGLKGRYVTLYADDLSQLSSDWEANGWTVQTGGGAKPDGYGTDKSLALMRRYHSDKRFMRCVVTMGADTVLRVNAEKMLKYDSNNGGATGTAIDFANKKLVLFATGTGRDEQENAEGISTVELESAAIPDKAIGSRKYIYELWKDGLATRVRLMDTLTGTTLELEHTGWGCGMQNHYYTFTAVSGVFPVLHNIDIRSLMRPDIVFVGDSITEGHSCVPHDESYPHLFRKANPDKTVVISALSGDDIDGVLGMFDTEFDIYKPRVMSLLIGANGGNTVDKLNEVKSRCEAIGCRLVLHRRTCQGKDDKQIAGNYLIEKITGVQGAKFDVATALDNYPLIDETHPGPRGDTSLYAANFFCLHPLASGHLAMYNRLRIDCPDMFYY